MSNLGEVDMEVLIYLLDEEWKNLSEIRNETSFGQIAINSARHKLVAAKFLSERKGLNKSIEINLTEKGRKAAESLLVVRRLLEED